MTAKPLKFGEVEYRSWERFAEMASAEGKIAARDMVKAIGLNRHPIGCYEIATERSGRTFAPVAVRTGCEEVHAEEPCAECCGAGLVECADCNGCGARECDLGHEHECEECDGIGDVECPDCH